MAYGGKIEVAQAALYRVGEAGIASLDDGSAPARIFNANYEGIVADYLTRHAWTWATKTVPLTYQAPADFLPWGSKWAVPAGVLNIRKLMSAGIDLEAGDWTYEDGVVLTLRRYDDLAAVTTYRANESKWPADFSEIVVMRTKALFLEGLLDKWQDAQVIVKTLEGGPGISGKIDRAIVRDKRQVPAQRVERVPLARIWRGGRGRHSFGRC